MRLVVCLKHAPESGEPNRGDPTIQDLRPRMDDHALELALRLKDREPDLEVVALSMGPPSARDRLLKALAMGADRAVWVHDVALTDDPMAVATVLAAALRRLDGISAVLAGAGNSEPREGATVPALAKMLDYPLITEVTSAELVGAAGLRAERMTENRLDGLEVPLPALLSVHARSGDPRLPSFKRIMTAHAKECLTWTRADLDVSGV